MIETSTNQRENQMPTTEMIGVYKMWARAEAAEERHTDYLYAKIMVAEDYVRTRLNLIYKANDERLRAIGR
jgi:hypothetical protein